MKVQSDVDFLTQIIIYLDISKTLCHRKRPNPFVDYPSTKIILRINIYYHSMFKYLDCGSTKQSNELKL